MRIVGGTHRSRQFHIPNNLEIRPTTDFAKEADFYGKATVATHMVNILRNFSAYRMQLFLYIKANGVPVNTMNLWGGMDGNM
jgi:hypothetical protein